MASINFISLALYAALALGIITFFFTAGNSSEASLQKELAAVKQKLLYAEGQERKLLEQRRDELRCKLYMLQHP